MSGLNRDVIQHALRTAREHGIRTVKIESGDEVFQATLQMGQPAPRTTVASLSCQPEVEITEAVIEPGIAICSPVVGYFNPAPGLEIDATVEPGQVIGTVSALGINNDVVAKNAGTITKLCAESGSAVEYGQPIVRVAP